MATVLRRAGGPATVIDHDRLRVAMVGATLARALEAHRTTREVDPVLDSADRAALGRLTALQRAVAAGHLLASLQLDDLATELEMPVAKVAAALSTAEAVAGGASALTAQMANHQAGITLAVSVDLVEWELASHPARAPARPWRGRALALAGVLAGAVTVALAVGAQPGEDRPALLVSSPDGAASSTRSAAVARLPMDERLSLADCDIQPASTALTFRGWLPLRDLSPSAEATESARAVYTLVTSTTAEWVGWQTGAGRPMFPRPVGRLGCAVDPATGSATVYAVAESWEPPEMVDGCPSSPVSRHGQNLEMGGPNAFVLLPIAGRSWWSRDPGVEINVRIAPSPSATAQIRALARPLGTGEAVEFGVRGLSIGPDRPASSNHYITLFGEAFPTAGCWLLSVAVEDEVVGSAVLPVTASVALRPAD